MQAHEVTFFVIGCLCSVYGHTVGPYAGNKFLSIKKVKMDLREKK
jgi:hypothetical protein